MTGWFRYIVIVTMYCINLWLLLLGGVFLIIGYLLLTMCYTLLTIFIDLTLRQNKELEENELEIIKYSQREKKNKNERRAK